MRQEVDTHLGLPMNDTTSDFAVYLTQGERILWQGCNTRMKQVPLLKSMGPALLGMILALAVAYYIVFVVSPGSVLYIGLGLDTEASVFLIVLLVFAPFLIRPLWQRRQSRAISLFGVELPVIAVILIMVSVVLLVIILYQGMSLSLILLAVMPSFVVIMAESQQDQNADYLVTNLSALIVPRGLVDSKRITLIPFKNLAGIQVIENRDGSGTLLFGAQAHTSNWARANSTPAFWNIEKPWDVYQLVRKQIAEQTMSS